MLHKQIEGKIKYRFICLLLNKLLEDKFITKDKLIINEIKATAIFMAEMFYKSLIFAAFKPKKEKNP